MVKIFSRGFFTNFEQSEKGYKPEFMQFNALASKETEAL